MESIWAAAWPEFEQLVAYALTALAVVAVGFVLLELLLLAAFVMVFVQKPNNRSSGTGFATLVIGLGLSGGAVTLHAAPTHVSQQRYRPATPLGLDEFYRIPDSNPLTIEKVMLGRRMFFDRALSADRSVACASCHRPQLAFSDTVAFSTGVYSRTAARNTPSILNRAYGRAFFSDGRAASLEETVLQPIKNPLEMDLRLPELITRLAGDHSYQDKFGEAFEDGITEQNIARALASYVRTLRTGNAPIDRFMNGERDALSAGAEAGLRLFVGKANCIVCHNAPNFADERFHNTGVAWRGGMFVDSGRAAVSMRPDELGAFKTPSLRNVALTAPYMHDGTLETLEKVVDFYARGGTANPRLDPEIKPLNLTNEEKRQLVEFLKALTGPALTANTANREY